LGITFIVVTHDQEEAMTLATRIGVMDKGQIMQVGEPQDIYEFPVSRFVANFIGDVNLFEGRISVDEHDHVQVRTQEFEQEFYMGHGISCNLDQKVSVAIRPEKIRIHKRDEYDLSERKFNYAFGKVHEIAYLGDVSIYHVEISSGRIIKATVPNLSRWNEENANVTWDDHVVLTWSEEASVVLVQ
jgi:ABC-type spermidine/putrescine transport systems, ATPase components